MDKSTVICPFCDNEQKSEERHVVVCNKCGKPFNMDPFMNSHPEEFWANPETSARF